MISLLNFHYFLIFGLFSLILIFTLILLSSIVSYNSNEGNILDNLSPYECGFNPFDDNSHQFDISFYLLGILFILFDIEISFLFPWIININHIQFFGYSSMFIFLIVLTLGFIFEWFNGVIDFC